MTAKTFHLISLGCAKNTVDSDSMAQLLARTGYHSRGEAEEADVLVVNTCGFIAPAREEAYQVLRELAANKRPGQLLIAAGCLTQRYGAEVAAQVPGVDGILGTRRWMDIVDLVQRLRCRDYAHGQPAGPICHLPDTPTIGTDVKGVMQVAVQGASAYLKIADGCRRLCTFCAIPLIKGSLVSRPMEIILGEARALRDAGAREMILLAQDTTDYGHDLGMKDGLVSLLQGLVAAAPEMDWIRILYTFPGAISDALIETMAIHPQILPYLDIPLQHAHPDTLRRMGRPANVDLVYHTLEKMRLAMPDLSLRTTFIVGFPGETDEEFNTLLEFVREIRIDKMGAFQYSCESGTPAEPLGDPVPAEVKQARWEQLMILQQGISLEKNQALVGRSLQVLVEGRGQVEVGSGLVGSDLETRPYSLSDGEKEQAILVGRSYRDAPEIDGLVLVEGLAPDETVPDMVQVHITGAMAYDLVGQLILNK